MIERTPPNEKTIRLKYIRILEKFTSRAISLLKHPMFDFNIFKINIEKYYQDVKKFEAIRLDSQYHKKLQDYVNLTLQLTQTHSKSFEDEQQLLLKEANLLHKEKNKTSYKKDKHKKKDFHERY
jgi:predicted DNA-binding WGR domain protein